MNETKEKAEQTARQNPSDIKDYILREDVTFIESYKFIKSLGKTIYEKKHKKILKLKALNVLRMAGSMEEKIKIAEEIKNEFFYGVLFKEKDVAEFLSKSFTVDKSILQKEKDLIL